MKQFLIQGGEEQALVLEDKARTLRKEGKALEMKNRILTGLIPLATLPL